MYNQKKERESAKSSPCKSLKETPTTATIFKQSSRTTRKPPNRKFFIMESDMTQQYYHRTPGVPATLPPKKTFDYFLERATRYEGDHVSKPAKYCFSARSVYNELVLALPEFGAYQLSYYLRQKFDLEHQVRLHVPAFDPDWECIFIGEHSKLSLAEEVAFRSFFIYVAMTITTDTIRKTKPWTPAPSRFFQKKKTYNEREAEEIERENYENMLAEELGSVSLQSGLQGAVGAAESSTSETENTQLVAVGEVEEIEPYPDEPSERTLSEQPFTDLNLAGVAWWLNKVTWSTTSQIQVFDLYNIMFNDVSANAAIVKSFQVHAISKLTARVTIKPNAVNFNSGLMGVTFVPLWNMWTPEDQQLWLNKYSLTQLPFTMINACSNNEVVVPVNFTYPLNYVPHISSPNYLPQRSLGALIYFPIVNLSIGDQGTRTCDLNAFIHFDSVEFVGKIDQRVNMQSGLFGKVGETLHAGLSLMNGNPDPTFNMLNKVAKSLINNKNADHPINPSPGQFVIPQALPSQSSVTNIENPVNSFRMDPLGTVNHNFPPTESFEDLVHRPGLFRQVTITSADSPKLLTSWTNQPLKPYNDYVPYATDPRRRHVPPVGVVASIFENAKGSSVYEVYAAMTDKHNFKLMFGVLPTPISPTQPIDLTYLRNSKFTELNYTNGKFTNEVVAPYFNPKTWIRIPSNAYVNSDCQTASYSPSYCYLYLMTTLSYATGVPSSVTLSIFERAGPDFELSVIKSPSLSVQPYSNPITYPGLKLAGYHWASDLTFTFSTLAPGGKPASADWIWNMWFTNPTPNFRAVLLYYGDTPTSGPSIPGYGNRRHAIGYVPLNQPDTSVLLVSVLDATSAPVAAVYTAIRNFSNNYTQPTFDALATYLVSTEMTNAFTYGPTYAFHVLWTPNNPIPTVSKQMGYTGSTSIFSDVDSPFPPTTMRGWGKKDFGEDFSSITNVLKRPYGDINIGIETARSASYPNAAFRVNVSPALPRTTPPPINSSDYAYSASAADIVLKGFIGFKGSIIMHALFPTVQNASVWTNYFPDAFPSRDIVQYPTATNNQRLVSTAPKQTFNLGINSAIRTAIPYYNPAEFIFTWSTLGKQGDNALVNSMGSVTYGLDVNRTSDLPATLRAVVMRSFGDDAALYFFRGFPPVVFFAENPPVVARNSSMADIEENPGPVFSRFVHTTAETAGEGFAQGIFHGVETYFSELATNLEGLVKTKLAEKGVVSTPDFSLTNILTVLFQESGHCILNPGWKTFLWSFGIILQRLGILGLQGAAKVFAALTAWLAKVAAASTQPSTGAVSLQGNQPDPDPHPTEFITILITGIATLFGIKEWKDSGNRTAKEFTSTFKAALQMGTSLNAFMKATRGAFKAIFQKAYFWYISEKPDAASIKAIAVTDSLIANWMKEVDFLTDRSIRESVNADPSLQLRVRVAYIVGRRLHAQLILANDRKTSPLVYYFNLIKKLYEDFAVNGFASHIRKEPWVIYVHGKTCIGKSQLQSDLCSRLLRAENIVVDGAMTYNVPTISPFMTDLRKQKVIAIDDIMSVVLPESLRTWLSLIFENATCASFKPNKPAIEDKDMEVENEILYINSNFEFIEHDSIPDKNAFHRRFHFKIEAALTDELVDARHETAKTVPKSILEKFEHLKFRRTLNPWNVLAPRYTDWMTYTELIEMAIKDFKAWRIAAQESVNRRMLCELQAKSLGLNNITYEDLQNDSFVEDKIREYLETLDTMDNERGIFSYDFRKLLAPHTLTLKETFNKFYAKVETPITEMLKKITAWTQSESNPVSLQGPRIRTTCDEILSMHKVLTDLWEYCEFIPGETEQLKETICGYFAPAALKYPHHAFVRAVRTCELAKGLHISNCRCEEEALDANLFCEEEKCFVKMYQKSLPKTIVSRIKDWNNLAITKLKSFYDQIWSSMNPILKGTLVLIGIVTTGAVFKLVFNWLTAKWNGDKNGIDKDFHKTFMFQSGHYSPGTSSKETKKSSQTKTNVSSFTSRAVTLQSGNFEDVVTKVRRNLRWITVCPEAEATNPNFERMLFPILGIHDRTYLVILHYVETITKALTDSDVKYIATLYDGHIHVPLSMNDFCETLLKWRCTEDSLSELGVWEAPARTHLVANILTHCGSRSKLSRMNNECFIVPCFTDLTSPCVLTRFNHFNSKYYDVSQYNHLVAYDGYNKPGFCGSLVFSKNLSTLVAIHTMGSDDGKLGFGELIFREDLETEHIVEPGFETIELEALSPEEIRNFPQYLKMLGKIPDHQVKKQGSKTVFVPSPLSNTVFEVRKEPAPLSSSDERVNYDWSPMKEGVKKHSNPPKGFERGLLLASAEATKELLQQSCPPPRNQVGILSIDEAVLGIPELKFKPLDMSTSPGFPLNVIRQRNQSGKAFLFHLEQTNSERKLLGLHPDLHRILSYEEHQRSQGIACFSPAIDCLKDELLKIEKARRVGGTRVFSTSPVQQVIAGKRLMGDWLMSYRSNWILSEHAISINPLSNDWMQLAQRLKTFPNILEGDYSGFGPQADSDVALAAITNIIEWYEFNDASFTHLTQLRALREELVNGIHICNNYVYSTISGIISGSFATAEINSEINKIYTRIAWMGTTNKDLATFDANVVLYTYGDDVIMSVSDEYIEQFNIRTISEFFAAHNIKFTNASKSNEIIEKVTLKEATFLKRSFRFDPTVPNQCLAPLDKVSIEEQINWVRNTQDPWDLMVASVDSMMIEAAMWGQSYYDEVRSKINTAFARSQKRYCFVDYRTMIKKIYEKESS